MMWWPFNKSKPKRPEFRQSYTDRLVQSFESAAAGGARANPLDVAAVEFAVGLYARSISCADVSGPPAITAKFLAQATRTLLRAGEAFYLIGLDADGIRLQVATHGDVRGGPDEATWRYQLTRTGPSNTISGLYPAEQVIHFQYASDPIRPWIGIPPWQYAGVSGAALAAIDRVIRGRAQAPYGSMIGLPESPKPGDGSTPMEEYIQEMDAADGQSVIYEHSGQWAQGAGPSRMESWDFGLGFKEAADARNIIALDIVSAFGVPSALLVHNADGTARREAFRQFNHTALAPLAKLIEEELSAKLETEVSLDLSPIAAADVAGRARSFKALTEAGLSEASAAHVVGLETGVGA